MFAENVFRESEKKTCWIQNKMSWVCANLSLFPKWGEKKKKEKRRKVSDEKR